MAPQKRVRYDEDDDEVIAVESASSALQHDSENRKRPRLSTSQNISKSQNARNRSASPSSSDDSDVEIPDIIDDEGHEAPPATQYESIRDENWEHFSAATQKKDDDLAEKKILAKSRRVGENRANENAIIEEITCVNFMCHEKLVVPLGPLINFVVGMNGSGKSAVLTAITLCLGGKAAATNRGSSLKSLIKGGEDQAVLIIKLKNQGNDAFQPDLYGPTIIIERHFSRSGSSSFKLRSTAGRLISSKKGDVDDIVEYYQLQVDNPMNVLTQDAAKSFITASTPAQKYKFFVEGVQLEALNNDYKIVLDICEEIQSKLYESRDDVEDLKKRAKAAEAKHKLATQRQGMRDQLNELGKKMAWAQVGDQEAKLEEARLKVVNHQQQIDRAETAANGKDEAFQKLEDALEKAKDAQARVEEELQPLQDEEEVARNAHEAAAKDVARIHAQHKTITDELKAAKRQLQSVKEAIAEEERRLQLANGDAHAQKLKELAEAKQSAKYAKTAITQNEEERPQLEENQRKAHNAMKSLDPVLQAKTIELNEARNKLNSLNSNQGDPLAGYDTKKMGDALREIRQDHGFRERPVGPMGLHVKLLQSKWSDVLESTLHSALNGFIVTSKPDQMRLSALLNRHGLFYCPVSIGSSDPLDPTGHEPDPEYETIYRVLTIDNELVKRQLIIGNNIEQTILVADRAKALRIMYDGSRPRNVKQCYALHDNQRSWGHRIGFGARRSKEIGPIRPPKGQRPRMKIDHASQINYQRETVDQLEREKNKLVRDLQQAKEEFNSCRNRLQQNIKEHRNLKIASQKADRRFDDIQAEIENLRGDDGSLDGLKQELEDAEKDQTILEESYGNASLERRRLNDISSDRKKVLDAVKIRMADYEAKLKKAQDKVNNISQGRMLELTAKNIAFGHLESLRRGMARVERERDEQAAEVASFTGQAEEICPRVPLDPGDTSKNLEAKCESLSRQLKQYQRQQGATDEEIHEAAQEALAVYRTAISARKEMEELLTLLKQSFMQRMDLFRRFQRHISARSRISFTYLLAERAFRGKLLIDHKTKMLDVHVEPDETTKSSKGRQTKTLSGGEKSFSSICLLLSLWEAMGAPLRCLDEFDVFMDDVNRDVSTKMIISAARKSVGRQFVLITPKALGAGLDADADVNVIKLKDPRDKQRRIDEMLGDGDD